MKRCIGAIGAALICLTCMQTVQGQTTTLRYGQIPSTIKTVSALQFYVAQRKGFFTRERVSLEMISIEGGAANMMMALDRGTVDITRTATFFLIQAALKGSEGVAIVGETATPIYSLIVKPEIKVSNDAVPNFQFTVSVVRRSWGEANKDALVRYIRGLASAFRFMRDLDTRDELIKTIVDTTGSSEEIARQTVSLYFEPDRGVVPKQGELDLKGLGQVIQFMSETGDLKPPLPSPERFVDLQYLRAAGIQ
jgi:ABC-type nitrate/sulfonate/bicarbonate transport system substrate-binding protein